MGGGFSVLGQLHERSLNFSDSDVTGQETLTALSIDFVGFPEILHWHGHICRLPLASLEDTGIHVINYRFLLAR